MRILIICYTLLFQLCGFTQNIMYFDYKLEPDRFAELEKLMRDAEIQIDEYEFAVNPYRYITNSETKSILEAKSKINLVNKSEARFYLEINPTYDTLIFVGVSIIFYDDDNRSTYYMLPTRTLEKNLSASRYMSYTEIPYYSLKGFLKEGNIYNEMIVEHLVNSEYSLLSQSFYLFTCPEMVLYSKPNNLESEILPRRLVREFIGDNESFDYNRKNFPAPETFKYLLSTSVYLDTVEEASSGYNFYNNESNLKVAINYEQVGVEYTVEGTTRTFWTETKYAFDYLTEYSSFQLYTELLYRSALFNKFEKFE